MACTLARYQFDPDCLAEPNDDPYGAYIFVDEGDGMMSNIDTFNVVPYIDSVLIDIRIIMYHKPPIE